MIILTGPNHPDWLRLLQPLQIIIVALDYYNPSELLSFRGSHDLLSLLIEPYGVQMLTFPDRTSLHKTLAAFPQAP